MRTPKLCTQQCYNSVCLPVDCLCEITYLKKNVILMQYFWSNDVENVIYTVSLCFAGLLEGGKVSPGNGRNCYRDNCIQQSAAA